mmetsp:Transcript_161798/g.519026  ORF Transcript_161798/g.519026 Transcript_161798/m.519026 type:complete len:687 (+) Transcript_161798:104-2164(+)
MEREVQWVAEMAAAASPQCQGQRVRHRADTIYLLLMGGRVLAMQTGFALLEAAYGRPMNAANIMMKNSMDLLLGALIFYACGYEIAFGSPTEWIEISDFDYAFWFLQFTYATTAATIDSGALAGRVSFLAYLALSIMVTGVIYPVAARWCWGGGWLQELGFVDFAGSGVVHLVGAVSALVSMSICGPRIGKFNDYRGWKGVWRCVFLERNDDEFYQLPKNEVEKAIYSPIKSIQNPVQLLFATFSLLCGFLAFNPASTFSTIRNADNLAARITVVTLLSASAGSIACIVVSAVRFRSLVLTVPHLTNAVLGGLIASCASCHCVPPAMSMVIGFVGACLTLAFEPVMSKLQLDDVVGAVAVHGVPGAWGVIAVALFARPHCQSELRGLFFGGGQEAWKLLGVQVIGLLALIAFTAVATYVTVVAIDLVLGFRSSRAAELIGMDFIEHRIDDGSLRLDSAKAEALSNQPDRDCLVNRVYRRTTHSPEKSYLEEKAKEHEQKDAGKGGVAGRTTNSASTSALGGTAEAKLEQVVVAVEAQKSDADLEGMAGEIATLSEDLGRLTAMLGQLTHNVHGNGSQGLLEEVVRQVSPKSKTGEVEEAEVEERHDPPVRITSSPSLRASAGRCGSGGEGAGGGGGARQFSERDAPDVAAEGQRPCGAPSSGIAGRCLLALGLGLPPGSSRHPGQM